MTWRYEDDENSHKVLSSKVTQDVSFWQERYREAMKNEQGALFAVAAGFDWSVIDPIHREIVDKFIKDGESVLDVACGIGRHANWFTGKYVGIDFVPEFIDEAKKQYPDTDFRVVDIVKERLSFDDGEFDWVVLISVKVVVAPVIGKRAWNRVEKELKRVAKQVLILELANGDVEETSKYEIL